MNLDKAIKRNILNAAIHENDVDLAEKLIAEDNYAFKDWEDEDCNWWSDYGVECPGTIWKSTAEWIVKVTTGVKGSENALCQAEWVIELYEKDEEESRIFQAKIDGTYNYDEGERA